MFQARSRPSSYWPGRAVGNGLKMRREIELYWDAGTEKMKSPRARNIVTFLENLEAGPPEHP